MTLQALPQQETVWIPTTGYFLAKLDSDALRIKVSNRAYDAYWKDWHERCDELTEALHPWPAPAVRLGIYQNKPTAPAPLPPVIVDPKTGLPDPAQPPPPKPQASWHEQRERFRRDFERQMADWVQLEPVSPRRDQVMRELAHLDMLAAAQQAWTAPGDGGAGPSPLGLQNPIPPGPPTEPPPFSAALPPPALPWPGQQKPKP